MEHWCSTNGRPKSIAYEAREQEKFDGVEREEGKAREQAHVLSQQREISTSSPSGREGK